MWLRLSVVGLALAVLMPVASAEILVGAAGPFAGPNGSLGQQLRRGVQMAIDDINATGGLRGERLAMKDLEDACDPRRAVDVATQLVTAGVSFVAGHYCSGASIPASKVYEQAGIVMISPASTHPKLTDEGGWNVFRICPRDDAQGVAAANLIESKFPAATVAVLHDQSPASLAVTRKLVETLTASNRAPVLDEGYKPGAKSYADLALRVRNSGAGVVYLGGSYVESAMLAKELRALGSSAQLIGGDPLLTEDFWKSAGDTAEGTLVTFMADPQRFQEAKPFIARFRDDGSAPEGHTLYAYAAVHAWVQAATAVGSKDSQRIATWLRSGNRLTTATGQISFDPKGDLREPRIAWFRWSDGGFSEVDPLTLLPPAIPLVP